MPFYIRIGKFAVSALGLMITISLFISYVVSLQIFKYVGILKSQTENIFLAGALSGILFGRLSYIIKNHDQISNVVSVFSNMERRY
ncbi:MAG: prolipoprotein diacylglyceryl transferase family protein [Hydrogenobaculum sp.]